MKKEMGQKVFFLHVRHPGSRGLIKTDLHVATVDFTVDSLQV